MDAWGVLMEMAANARRVVGRIGSNVVLRLTAAMALWTSAHQVLTRRHKQLKRFGVRIRSKPLAQAFFSWLAVLAATILAFARQSRLAALLLVPYWAWGAFATYLTFEIWRLN